MIIHRKEKFYKPQEKRVSIEKDYGNGIKFYADIVILSEKFIEYQKDLFNEFFSKIIENLSQDNVSLKNFQSFFEDSLQELNSKLNVFISKIKDIEGKMEIRGFVQIFFNDVYISSMIGDVSIAIFREGKLNYVMGNDLRENQQIDVFSEFIEGEIEGGDNILCFGSNIFEIMDENDLENIPQISKNEEKDILITTKDIISSRIEQEEINFLILSETENQLIIEKTSKPKIFSNNTLIKNIKEKITQYRYPIVVILAILVIVYLIYSLILSMSGKKNNLAIIDNEIYYSDITIEDIAKEFENFTRLDPSGDQKKVAYDNLMKKLDVLEGKGKWVRDVQNYKKSLKEAYLRGFKIYPISPNDNIVSMHYSLNETDKEAIGDLLSLQKSKEFMIGGTKGGIVGILTDSVRKDPIAFDMPNSIKGCNINLKKDGLYCFSEEGKIFNLTKSGWESVITNSKEFPSNIEDVGTYSSNRIFVLTNNEELNNKGIYIVRYNNLVGFQTKFGEAVNYLLKSEDIEGLVPNLGSGFNSFAIDGTFLMWSKTDQKLYQYKSDTKIMRSIKMQGGDNTEGFSANVKVMTDVGSNYIYLMDLDKQSFSMYKTSPYKTNTAYQTNYTMQYGFKLLFDFGESKIIDSFIEHGKKPLLYVLTDKGIYRVDIYNFFEESN